MLLSVDAVGIAAEMLRAEDFYRPAHGVVFGAICSLHARGEAADAVTVLDYLRNSGLVDDIGGPAALISLQSNTPATSNAGRYAAIVADRSRARRLIAAAAEIAELGYTADDSRDAVEAAEAMVFGLADVARRGSATRLGDALMGHADLLEARALHDGPIGVPTGWADLDRALLGLHPGQLVCVAARPGMGKSAFAAALSANVARSGAPAVLVSCEMTLPELLDRYVAAEAVLDLQQIRSGKIPPKDWARVNHAFGSLAPLPVYLDDDPGASVLTIRSLARRVASKEQALGVVIVDYLQLLNTVGKVENRQVEVAQLSRGLKRLAMELEVPVVALSQLNRELEHRADKRPTLADLRESGAIENDSDVVMFLYRDEYYNRDSPDAGVVEVIVAKQRNGPTGTVKLVYEASRGTFRDFAPGRAA
jgi:replicative DNA helicase